MNEDFALAEAIRSTEAEIFADGVGKEPFDPGGDTSLEQLDGWDGQPLSDDEQVARLERGDDLTTDRPLALKEETAAYEAAVARAAELEQENKLLREKYDPAMRTAAEVERDARRQKILDMAIEDPDGLLNEIGTMQQERVTLDMNRVDASLRAAHEKYGPSFEAVFNSLDPKQNPAVLKDPVARALVQRVWADKDPGEALMDLAENGAFKSLQSRGERSRSGNLPPFMRGENSPTRRAAPSQASRSPFGPDEYWSQGRSSNASAEEEDIFAHATRR